MKRPITALFAALIVMGVSAAAFADDHSDRGKFDGNRGRQEVRVHQDRRDSGTDAGWQRDARIDGNRGGYDVKRDFRGNRDDRR